MRTWIVNWLSLINASASPDLTEAEQEDIRHQAQHLRAR